MKTLNDLITLVQAWIDQKDADGCVGCRFSDRPEWKMPCIDCRRNHKDYWRPKSFQEGGDADGKDQDPVQEQ